MFARSVKCIYVYIDGLVNSSCPGDLISIGKSRFNYFGRIAFKLLNSAEKIFNI